MPFETCEIFLLCDGFVWSRKERRLKGKQTCLFLASITILHSLRWLTRFSSFIHSLLKRSMAFEWNLKFFFLFIFTFKLYVDFDARQVYLMDIWIVVWLMLTLPYYNMIIMLSLYCRHMMLDSQNNICLETFKWLSFVVLVNFPSNFMVFITFSLFADVYLPWKCNFQLKVIAFCCILQRNNRFLFQI